MVQQWATHGAHLPPPEANTSSTWGGYSKVGVGQVEMWVVQENILPLTGQQHLQRKGEPLSTPGTALV